MRRFFQISLGLTAAFALALATLPWWLGSVLPSLARTRGLTFRDYEHRGYTRFVLTDVAFRTAGVTVNASRLEADSPLVWMWRRAFGRPHPVEVDAWRVTVAAPPAEAAQASASKPGGWTPLRSTLRSVLNSLRPWIPAAHVGAGEVTWPGGQLKLASAELRDATLTLHGLSSYGALRADGQLVLFPQNQDQLQLTATFMPGPVQLALESRATDVTGQLTYLGQSAALAAHFDATTWAPRTASLVAQHWSVPGARLPQASAYATVQGSSRLDWREGQLTVDLAADGTPAPGRAAPPLAAQLQARSDGPALRIEKVHLALPGLTANLSQPVVIDRTGKLLSGDSRFTFTADLAAWAQLTTTGTVSGEATVSPGNGRVPRVAFQLSANSLAFRDGRVSALNASGRLEWPQLFLETLTLASPDGDRLTGRGGWDFSTAALHESEISGTISRASVAPWLPTALDFSSFAIRAHARGAGSALTHDGEIRGARVAFSPLKPLDVSIQWQGRVRTLEQFTAEATGGSTQLKGAGSLDATGLALRELTLTAPDVGTLALTRATTLRWSPTIDLAGLELANPGSSLRADFALGPTGRLDLAVKNFPSTALVDVYETSKPAWRIHDLAARGAWDRGPLTFTLRAAASVVLNAQQSAQLTLNAAGDDHGLKLNELQVLEGSETALRAQGQLPITLTPADATRFHILPDGALNLTASTEPTARFWQQLQTLAGIEIVAPRFTAQLEGTWSHPRGTAALNATRLAVDSTRFNDALPDLEAVDLRLSGDPRGIAIDRFSASLDGQAVRASGRLPLVPGAWERLMKTPLAVLTETAELEVEIPDADMAALSRRLPDYLAPQGRLKLALALKSGGNFDGTLRLSDAASRPLGVLGALQDINADLHVAGRTLGLRDVRARAGGQPVTLAGKIELPPKSPPRLDLALKGENLPLVRKLGLLLRGDLDLRLTTTSSGQTQLGGRVNLHDSLFLADVRDLLPSGGRGPAVRAPYFSVEVAPFNRWRLDVAIAGDRFLRLRTALFTGVASAHFRLSGTLGDPLALGEAVVNEGTVLLPFASFAVQQSSLRLTADNPHDLQLWLTGATRRYGYDLRMELSGALSAPALTFTANPALESQQVLLLVMAGQVPSNATVITDRQRITRLGTYLGQSLLGSLGGDTAAGDRLSITTGEGITQQGRETYAMEYRLDDRWSLVGEYDEFDDYNAGVKWRIFANERRAFHEKP